MNLKKLTRIILIVAVLLLLSVVPVNAVVFNAAFDSDFYVNCYPDLKAAFGDDANAAYNHYLTYGIKEGRIASPVFDVKAYIRNYPDLQAAFGDDYVAAYNHFLTNGMNEGRLASDSFNVQVYIANYPDLQAAFGNDVAGAYSHYLNYGMAEGRVCGALEAGATAPEDHVHDYTEFVEYSVQPTCQAKGEAIYKCTNCDETKTVEVEASDEYHEYVEKEVVRAATETQTGISVYICKICQDTDTKITPVLECDHPEASLAVSTTAATCTTEGKTETRCNKCQKVVKTEVIPMEEHTIETAVGSGYILQNPVKCSTDGSERVYCTTCKQYVTRAIPAHEYEKVSEVPATCTVGKMVTSRCKVCKTEKVEEVGNALDHTWGTTIMNNPTCTTAGLKTEVCTRCGTAKKTDLPKLEHSLPASSNVHYVYLDENGNMLGNDGVKLTDPYDFDTNSDKGNDYANNKYVTYKNGMTDCRYAIAQIYVCANYSSTPANNKCTLENGEISIVIAKKAAHSIDTTKTKNTGLISYDEDGNVIKGDNGKIIVTEGTKVDCTHAYAEVFTCATCHLEQYRIITPKTSHAKIANTENVIPAGCTTKGWTTYSCSNCNKTVKEAEIAPLGHDFVYKAPTCTTAGSFKCTRCTTTIDQAITDIDNDSNKTATEKAAERASLVNKKLAQLKAANVDGVTNETQAEAYKNYGNALKHNFEGNDVFTSNDKKYVHCKRCNLDIEVTLNTSTLKITTADEYAQEFTVEDKNQGAEGTTPVYRVPVAEEGAGDDEVTTPTGIVEVEVTAPTEIEEDEVTTPTGDGE